MQRPRLYRAPCYMQQRDMYNTPVLVLNQNYEPLNICSARRAVLLVMDRKAEVLENNSIALRSASLSVLCPSVIRLNSMVKRPRLKPPLNRHEVFIRDNYTCQYCGIRTRDLTLDHVIPRSKGGPHTWDNLVSACRSCNHRKGGKLLAESRMHLARMPKEPKSNVYHMVYRYMQNGPLDEWLVYLPGIPSSSSQPS